MSRRVRATGQRVVKHRHVVDEALQLSVPEFTVLGVLLLRGAQTPGELKQRTERWHAFRSLDDIEETLQRLAERDFVRQLERRPGQKESRWIDARRRAADAAAAAPGAAATPARARGRERAVRDRASRRRRTGAAAPVERSLDVRNPATGERIRSVAVTDEREIAQKVERARRAQPAWAARPYDERAALRARVPRPARGRSRGVRADHDARGRQADRAVAQRGRARSSSGSTGTSTTSAR